MPDPANYVLIKRGLYYCPNGQGYTGLKRKAGLYPASYALGLDGVTAVPFADADEFAPACWEETKLAEREAALATQADTLAKVTAERDALREALGKVLEACDRGRMVPKPGGGACGMTIEAQTRACCIHGVAAWPVEEAREVYYSTFPRAALSEASHERA